MRATGVEKTATYDEPPRAHRRIDRSLPSSTIGPNRTEPDWANMWASWSTARRGSQQRTTTAVVRTALQRWRSLVRISSVARTEQRCGPVDPVLKLHEPRRQRPHGTVPRPAPG